MGRRSRKLLIVDYCFPPSAGPGVRRTLGYLNHLGRYGWEASVLTVRSGDASFYDPSLLRQVPDDVHVYRTSSVEPLRLIKDLLMKRERDRRGAGHSVAIGRGRPIWTGARWLKRSSEWFVFPDRHLGWLPFALAQGRHILGGQRFDVIYSTMTAVTSHFVASLLAKEFSLPWVADFQDPWTGYVHFPSRTHEAVARLLEGRILNAADRVTVTTEHHKRWLLDGFRELPEQKVEVIPIGFDPEIFDGLERALDPGFVITHFGTFYATRSPETFLRAVARALAARPALARDLRIRFVGHFDAPMLDATVRTCDELGLQRTVRLEGIVPYKLGLQMLLSSSLLLFVGDSGFWGKVMSSAKLAEYLGANRPILALVPEGSIAGTVRRAHAGTTVEPDDVDGTTAAILEAHDLWSRGMLTAKVDEEFVRDLGWSRLTAKLAAVLEAVVSPSPVEAASIGRSAPDGSAR